MRQYLKPVVFIILILFHSLSLKALDVGLLLDQNASSQGQGTEWDGIEYTGTLVPYVSGLVGNIGEFIFSAALTYGINPGIFVPELLRTEVTVRSGIAEFKLGRIPYRDPLGIIAEGFFDGTQASFNAAFGTVSAGIWYTGGLYKKRAFITMNDDEMQSYNTELNYDNFFDTYFAPSRVFSAASWEHPSLLGLFDMKVAVMGQFDMPAMDLSTQYISAKAALPLRYFVFELGGCFEMIEDSSEFSMAMAAETGFTVMLPTQLENHISLRGRYSSGEGTLFDAFLPLTTIPQGNLFDKKLSGLSILSLSYLSRIHHVLSAGVSASSFIRSDFGADSGGCFLGTEFFGRFFWSLSSEIQLNAGGGVFMPLLGNAAPNDDMLWRVELNLILSFF